LINYARTSTVASETSTVVSEVNSVAAAETQFAPAVVLQSRAKEINSTLTPFTQSKTTIAVATATNAEGKTVTLVASSEKNLRPAQRAALQPGEVAVKGNGHAEATIVNHAKENGLTVNAIGASRPICRMCDNY
jgi:hypothetical protein